LGQTAKTPPIVHFYSFSRRTGKTNLCSGRFTIELTAHLTPQSRFSINEPWFLLHVDRCETEDDSIEAIHRRFDGVGFCVVPKEQRWIVDHDHGWTLSLRHPFQLLRSSSDNVSRTISDFTAAESAPSDSFKMFSLLPLSWALLNVLHLCLSPSYLWDRWRNLEFSHQMMLWCEEATDEMEPAHCPEFPRCSHSRAEGHLERRISTLLFEDLVVGTIARPGRKRAEPVVPTAGETATTAKLDALRPLQEEAGGRSDSTATAWSAAPSMEVSPRF
jgi:hypothetical protein